MGLMTILTAIAMGVLPAARPGPLVFGAVTAEPTGEPVASALIEVVAWGVRTWSDSAGEYSVRFPSPGVYRLHIARMGYQPRDLDVMVGADSGMRLDIVLLPAPVRLAAVAVRERDGRADPAAASRDLFDPGARRVAGNELHANPAFGAADALAVLATGPGATIIPDAPTSLHVRGGAGDQTRVLLDGIPLYDPYHVGGTLTAIDPDVLASVTLHGAAPAARYGGAVAGVVSLRSATERPRRFATRGAMEGGAIRQLISSPLPWASGWFLLSGRRSIGGLGGGQGGEGVGNAGFSDMFGKSEFRIGAGRLELFVLDARNALRFDAVADSGLQQAAQAGGGTLDGATPSTTALQNEFRSHSLTRAAIWTVGDPAAVSAAVRGWYSSNSADAGWGGSMGRLSLQNRVTSLGTGAHVAWRAGNGWYETGAGFENVGTVYRTGGTANPSAASAAATAFVPQWSAFVDGQWTLGPRWGLAAGLREVHVVGERPSLEPRVAVSFEPAPHVVLAAGYARLQQRTQSLRNDESLVDGVFGLPLLATARRTDGVPVGEADQVSASLRATPVRGLEITVDAYHRRLSGLALVAPVTGEPFAVAGVSVATGVASGLGVSARYRRGPLFGTASYSVGTTVRIAGPARYHPGYGTAHQLAVAASWQADPATRVQAAVWGAIGRPSSVTYGAYHWVPAPLSSGGGDLAGSPRRFLGALGSATLPSYWRVDLGVRREWRPTLVGRSAGFTAVLTVANIFNHANLLGATSQGSGGLAYAITLPARTIVAGLEWHY